MTSPSPAQGSRHSTSTQGADMGEARPMTTERPLSLYKTAAWVPVTVELMRDAPPPHPPVCWPANVADGLAGAATISRSRLPLWWHRWKYRRRLAALGAG